MSNAPQNQKPQDAPAANTANNDKIGNKKDESATIKAAPGMKGEDQSCSSTEDKSCTDEKSKKASA